MMKFILHIFNEETIIINIMNQRAFVEIVLHTIHYMNKIHWLTENCWMHWRQSGQSEMYFKTIVIWNFPVLSLCFDVSILNSYTNDIFVI